jgi:hypothetical protein
MWRHDKLEDMDKYGGRRLYLAGAEVMGPDTSRIVRPPRSTVEDFFRGEELRGG